MDRPARERLREALADLEHEQWGLWTAYQMLVDSPEMRQRWQRQIDTPYADLSERERDSDREWADRVLAIVGPFLSRGEHERGASRAAVALLRAALEDLYRCADEHAAWPDAHALEEWHLCRDGARIALAATEPEEQ